jgi:ABC-type glycerol-3-phosphate transport system substrate-binding protein
MRLRLVGSLFVMGIALLLTSCGPQKAAREMTVLIRMMPAQERFFREQIIAAFEKASNCKINVATFNNEWDIQRLLDLEKAKKIPEIGLVKTPFEMTRVLVYKGFMKPLTAIKDSESVLLDLAEYHQLATGLGYVDGLPYYLPRKLETRIIFYRKSMVADAVGKFAKYKTEIQKVLKKENGYGLPKDYALEADPNQWDIYDLYVAGYIWAHETYNGVKMPRIAHRGERYEGTALDIVDRALQLGASHKDVLTFGDTMSATLLWENVFIRDSLYNPGMWQDPWRGSGLYNGIKDGKVFLTYVQQIDCFNIHGWADDPAMQTYLPDAGDMGLAVVPRAVSFDLNAQGAPAIEGKRGISTGGWWWGIPKTSPNAQLSYEFARFITNHENQAKECARFGMIPVRKDILNNVPEVFNEGWVGDIFLTSIEQIKQNELTTVPLVRQYAEVEQNVVDAWYKLCVNYDAKKDGIMTLPAMKAKLAADFLAKQKEILGDEYPK